jgi:hypothetical protein
MTTERDGNQEIDPRIKGIYVPVGRKGLQHIIKTLKNEGLLSEEDVPQKPLMESGLTLLTKSFTDGLGISLSQARIKNMPTNTMPDEISLIENIGNSFGNIKVEKKSETSLNLIFPHSGCPIKKIPLLYDPDKINEKTDNTIILRQITIVGIDPDEQLSKKDSHQI